MIGRAVARLRARGAGARNDAGFTLVELLIAIVIQGLIMGALAMAFIGIMRGSSQAKAGLDKTTDARIAAQYIVSDARNSSGPELSLSDTTSCPDPSPPVEGTATPVARFNWSSTSSSGATTANIVNYVLVSNSLLRRQCVGGTLVSDEAVASSVQSVTAACSPTSDCSGTPTSITVTVTETVDANGSSYQYSLNGAFRKLIGTGQPTASTGIILLGGASACNAVKISGGASLRVYGNAKINTADVGACKAMDVGSTVGAYQAGGTQILTGGTCITVCPVYTNYSPAIADPYAGLPVPSTAGMTPRTDCAGGTAQPGVYAAFLQISSPCTFSSGIYVFQNGLTVSAGGSITSAAGGVFIYLSGGAYTQSGSGITNLTAMTSGTYAGVVLWQAGSSPLTISNGNTFGLNGVVYAPNAQVKFTGGAYLTSVTAIVAQSVLLSGSAMASIGSPSRTPLSITTTSPLPGWTVNRPSYSTTLAADGGDALYVWSATNLPTGLAINSNTGVISGTPTATGTKTVAVTLNDANGDTPATANLSLTINAAPSITTASLPAGEATVAYSTTMTTTGGTTPFSWSATGLPPGLSINSSTGVISGTPTTAGTFASVVVSLTDAAGATTSHAAYSLTINPQPTISSVVLANGTGTAGTIEKADTVAITFSATMKVSSFCSTWSNDANNQSLNTDNNVTVSVSDGSGATNDVLTVTSTSCTFNLGSIDLGSPSYVSSAATFAGSAGNKSTITWTASTHKLVILLGTKTAGTVANVASSTPVYTASGAIQDPAGAGLGNSPYTLAPAKQF